MKNLVLNHKNETFNDVGIPEFEINRAISEAIIVANANAQHK